MIRKYKSCWLESWFNLPSLWIINNLSSNESRSWRKGDRRSHIIGGSMNDHQSNLRFSIFQTFTMTSFGWKLERYDWWSHAASRGYRSALRREPENQSWTIAQTIIGSPVQTSLRRQLLTSGIFDQTPLTTTNLSEGWNNRLVGCELWSKIRPSVKVCVSWATGGRRPFRNQVAATKQNLWRKVSSPSNRWSSTTHSLSFDLRSTLKIYPFVPEIFTG